MHSEMLRGLFSAFDIDFPLGALSIILFIVEVQNCRQLGLTFESKLHATAKLSENLPHLNSLESFAFFLLNSRMVSMFSKFCGSPKDREIVKSSMNGRIKREKSLEILQFYLDEILLRLTCLEL